MHLRAVRPAERTVYADPLCVGEQARGLRVRVYGMKHQTEGSQRSRGQRADERKHAHYSRIRFSIECISCRHGFFPFLRNHSLLPQKSRTFARSHS